MNREKLREIIFVNLGQASMCWSEWPTGVFDSTKAVELGEEIMKAIDEYVKEDKEPGWNNPLVDYLDWEEEYRKKEMKNEESEWQRRRRLEAMKEAERAERIKEKELIKKILADRSNAAGFENFDPDRPQYFFEGFKYVLNSKLDRIISVEVPTDFVQKRWLMDDLREQDAAWERIKKNKTKEK